VTTTRDPRDPLAEGRIDEILGSAPPKFSPLSQQILDGAGPEEARPAPLADVVEGELNRADALDPDDTATARRTPLGINAVWVVVGAVIALCALITAAGAVGIGPAAAPKAHASEIGSIVSARSCSAPLSYGRATVTRTTGKIGNRRYWTSIHLGTTGNRYKLVTDRFHGLGTKGTIIRRARGVTGIVTYAGRSWGGHSRTPNIVAIVNGVDQVTGRIIQIAC
jgi:hypothetical protein